MTTIDAVKSVIMREMGWQNAKLITPHSSFTSMGINSLEYLDLMLELEEELGIVIEQRDYPSLVTVQDVVEYADSRADKDRG